VIANQEKPMTADYTLLDRPEVLDHLFHPRPEHRSAAGAAGAVELTIPVAEGISLGARFHPAGPVAPNILFFHGNGEIVADYDNIAPVYRRLGLGFLPVDYRGYGRSSGRPTVSAMMADAHRVLEFTVDHLSRNGHTGPLIVMGRSLGSASAIELAAARRDQVAGLIVESGFAWAGPLLDLLGAVPRAIGFTEERAFDHIGKLALYTGPLLVVHAELDRIIPFADGQALYDACPSAHKTLLEIRGADHNDIMLRAPQDYFAAIRALADAAGS
jgi:pimeloyl-ACP methyl ester carboxylesterase